MQFVSPLPFSPIHRPSSPSRAVRIEPGAVLIFLHNLKTGGTTLRSILARQYHHDEICVLTRRDDPADVKPAMFADPRLRLIEGHVPFGLHAWLSRPATYVTLLRDPLERIVSLYYFIREGTDRHIHRQTRAALGSLEEFVSSGVLLEVDNGQTRRLSGLSPAYGRCTEAMLERAKANIRERFALVGLTERFDESVLLLRRLFGWPSALYLPRKVNQLKQPVAALPSGTVRLIEAHNRFDRQLYDYAAELFERQVAELGPGFRAELATFSWLNEQLARHGTGKKRGHRSPQADGADPLAMLLDAHASLLTGRWDTQQLRRELDGARSRVRELESSKLWRLQAWCKRTRERVRGAALLGRLV